METVVINPGPLTSFNSLSTVLGPQLDSLRSQYVHGKTPRIVLDITYLTSGHISIAALAALLSICHRLSRFFGGAIWTDIPMNSDVQHYLIHVDFFRIAARLGILKWDFVKLATFLPTPINPSTKLLYFADVSSARDHHSPEAIIRAKALLKQRIGPNLSLRCAEIFRSFDPGLMYTVENTTLEMITNSLIHAKDIAFVAVQRTSKRITISVCDSGIGFKRSLPNSYPNAPILREASTVQAIALGSIIQNQEHGLRLAISEVLNYNQEDPSDHVNQGWVVISSFDGEIRWQKDNWRRILEYYSERDVFSVLPDTNTVLGTHASGFMEYEVVQKGYWKTYSSQLVGTRISFEISLVA